MKRQNLLSMVLFTVVLLLFYSCAGLESMPAAESEFNLGLSFFNRGQYDEAITHFIKATELDPNYGRPYLYLGRSYLNLGKWREAIAPLRTALKLSPDETKKELHEIIIDAVLQHTYKIDRETQSQLLELVK